MKQLIIMLLIALAFTSCKKEEEEPLNFIGNWTVDSYEENGVDQTTLFKATYLNYIIKFDAANNYIETYTIGVINFTNAGPWKLTNNGTDLELTNQADNVKRYIKIEELNTSSATITENSGEKSYNLRKI
jgi:hypothetical protein